MNAVNKAELLRLYSDDKMSATEVRRRLGKHATYGDILIGLAENGLPLPRASQQGREARIAAARELLFRQSRG